MRLTTLRPSSIALPTLAAVVVAAAALLFSHGSGVASTSAGSGTAPVSGKVTVDISNYMYSPTVLTVKVGTTVTIANKDSSNHTATSDTEGAFDSGTLANGQSMRVKLNKVGTFTYHCAFHGFMHGTIKVVA